MEENSKQTEANKKWQEKNREHARYLRNRSTTRSFLRKQATLEDIEEMENLILERKKSLLLDSE
ncbi:MULTISPECIES: hypothetical protein [Enterococcus]|uniref:Phage protein n=1 Tax=Enterococcus gallinarum TaxID=1353 RepID=A0ABD4HRQ6_ENTGA|nr:MULTISPECIES: hypothetical protein [Enterococcus]MBA0949495.1 hypothetical protein [Enterococcus gallinarum]MBA0962451.1 hypothetical protein [Enterococcus gallinarum]MBA0970387.1 hypothetical protein [Enterococcus gallinarum]MBA0973783.1 hypothetical protein [Enterococcus gallinarum]MCR1931879.1 hypothetical protein [Enterococcus gallinarum]